MKTTIPAFGWILLGLSLCLSPAISSAQERTSRGHSVFLGRKLEARSHQVTYTRFKAPSGGTRISGPALKTAPSGNFSQRPQRFLTPPSQSSSYTTTSVTLSPPETRRSSVSILPDGRVITAEATYEPAWVTTNSNSLNEFDLVTPAAPEQVIQYPNSAMAPPPPPVETSWRPSPAKPDLSKVQTAEKVSPGLVKSPYPPHSLLDVQGMRKGSLAEDPASKKLFRVP